LRRSPDVPQYVPMVPRHPVVHAIPAVLPIGLLVLGAVLAASCQRASDPATPAADRVTAVMAALASGTAGRLIDLTHPLSPDSLYWPTGAPFEHEREGWSVNEAGYWYASGSFASPEHLGTHLDAPVHFAEQGWTAARIPLERLIGPGVVIDISAKAGLDPDATLVAQDIDAWERSHGPIPDGAIVVVRTGWSANWPNWNSYYGTDTPMDVSTLHFPGVSPEAATILGARGVAGVGIDTASIDPGRDTTFRAHQVLAARNIFNLENLTSVGALPASGFVILAFPMKIEDGTGGPTRVVALVP